MVVALATMPPGHDFVADRATRGFAWQGKFILNLRGASCLFKGPRKSARRRAMAWGVGDETNLDGDERSPRTVIYPLA
ncbi:hypothetical protein [Sphingobium scionense]|uniref:Uncharacterized protein n=1 Tax=Sphingobium scionense TaxID=1404341 RepID=A0A7W6LQW8_9SPHN|nr:hypothetical protein [Sphingobium scionense]MBB4147701.1 hypothetical protein [Sphingobium scionense]